MEMIKSALGKVASVYEWMAEAYADVVGNYPKISLGLMLFVVLAALV